MNRRGGQTDIRLQRKKEVLKSRRERSRAAHLVADGLVLEPRLVQDLLQLLVVEVGYPDGLGQPCVLTLLQGLGGRGGEQSFEMSDRPRINAGKKICSFLTGTIMSPPHLPHLSNFPKVKDKNF